ncbi:TPM domain-containing protein [Parabacteroides sp. PF5-9]|uniref:TPM domain-containing protein n=1 Tax=Parabacteroides sp. PF5-9 TaxID=1742404 RepID=UPI0024750EB1|nr:TPM domain-containing protein [Parabacteroides sp. PF5-9]MDH6356627.1 uncharacterized protein [Parabacteroides sp. PF5-9]
MKRLVNATPRYRSRISTCIFFLFLVSTYCIYANQDYTVGTIPNVRLTDRLNHVSNPDGIIQTADVAQINALLQIVEDSLGIEVAVVAINSIGDNDARMFATDLFKHWGIGKKNKDNGLLIQLVTEPSQRSVVFETGYGIEDVLPDIITYRIQQQYMIPDMKAGDYSSGILKGVRVVKEYLLASDYARASLVETESKKNIDDSLAWIFFFFGIFLLIAIFLISILRNRPKRCPQCGEKTFIYVGRQTLLQPTFKTEGVAVDTYRCKNCGYTETKRRQLDRLRRSSTPYYSGGAGSLGRGSGSRGGRSGGSWGGGRSGGGGSISRF